MAKLVFSEFAIEEKIKKLDENYQKVIVHDMLQAGAKVLQKEIAGTLQQHHHVISGDLVRSVKPTEIHEDIDHSYIDVYTQGTDHRGVSNVMKNIMINYGYYQHRVVHFQKKDPYLKPLRERIAPRIQAVMNQQYLLSLEKLGITNK